MVRRATIAMAVVAASWAPASKVAGAPSPPARASQAQQAGFCVPAPEDSLRIAETVGVLGVGVAQTRPIAILDTGVDPSVPELAGRVLPGIDARTGGAADGDPDGHGTQLAALAAAAAGGMRGVSPTSPILPVRVSDSAGPATADAIAKGIAVAVQRGAGVVAIASSTKLADTSKPDVVKVTRAIDDAFGKGVLVVAPSGADGDATPSFPATLPHVLVAGGAGLNGLRASFSNTGPWVDVLAPAEGVTSSLPPDVCSFGYGFSTGTAFAVPSVAGAAALVGQLRPQLTVQQRFELIRRSAQDIGIAGRDDETGYGMVNVAVATTATPQAKENNAEVDDDPFWVRGAFAKTHPPYLTKKKLRFKASGSVSPAKDPADVYPVRLLKRERMVVTVSGAGPGALLELSILDPRAGDFDILNGVERRRLVSTGGLSGDPQLEVTAKTTGTYLVAIEAADPVDPDDPTATPADIEPYKISAFKQRPKAKKTKKQ